MIEPTKIQVSNVDMVFQVKDRPPVLAVQGADLDIPEGAFVSIIGPSGCGKSTLLNVISGLMRPSSGEVYIDGQAVNSIRRDVGYMFARDALMPWRTAQQNVEFGLELRAIPNPRALAKELLKTVGLEGFENHYRHELSQGMRQRVALARTLATDPDILLMDEPFSALDAQTRMMLQDTFLRIWESRRKTVLLVTHDLIEATLLSDRVAVFTNRPGRIKAIVDIDLPRPRSATALKFDRQFQDLYNRLWEDLKNEVSRV